VRIKIDPADKVFSQYIRLRDGECLRCHSKVKLNDRGLPISHNASHFHGRGKESTRFDPDNVCTLCFACHSWFTAHPQEHYDWQVKRLGQKKIDELTLKVNTYHKKNRELELIYWRKELKNLL
jgi:5-methylcytosine-specific restriction endonuclease McrA